MTYSVLAIWASWFSCLGGGGGYLMDRGYGHLGMVPPSPSSSPVPDRVTWTECSAPLPLYQGGGGMVTWAGYSLHPVNRQTWMKALPSLVLPTWPEKKKLQIGCDLEAGQSPTCCHWNLCPTTMVTTPAPGNDNHRLIILHLVTSRKWRVTMTPIIVMVITSLISEHVTRLGI